MIGILLAILFVLGFYAVPMLIVGAALAWRERRAARRRWVMVYLGGLITRDVQ